MDLIQSLQTNDTTTENGMSTNSSSLNRCVDLFFIIGAVRGEHPQRILNKFIKAFNENPLIAIKILFWSRDIREGAGERTVFRIIWKWLCEKDSYTAIKNLPNVEFFGRWDDHLVGIGTPSENDIIQRIGACIGLGNGLAAKWMPRKGPIANILRKKLGLTPKEYRKFLSSHTNVVESLMCGKKWNIIDYSKLPSLSLSRYTTAFKRNDGERFLQYIEDIKSGKTTINAKAVYPYDVIKNLNEGNADLAIQQWNALPNYMLNTNELILPLVDVSGSMKQPVTKNNPNLDIMNIALSLGLYISERNIGAFKDYFMTFSNEPTLQHLTGDLEDRLNQLEKSAWDMTTNLEQVFKTILNSALENNVQPDGMPTKVLILSDMEFNKCIVNPKQNAMEMIESAYCYAGYKVPQIVFWNLKSRHNNIPVKFNKLGTALISGFSPSILKSVLNMDMMNPESVMLKTVTDERYENILI